MGDGGALIERISRAHLPKLFESKLGVRRTLHKAIKKKNARSIVLYLANLAHVPDTCTPESLRAAAMNSVINRSDIADVLDQYTGEVAPVPVTFLHVNKARSEAYIIPVGGIRPSDAKSVFRVESLSRDDADHEGAVDEPDAPLPYQRVPLPLSMPSATAKVGGSDRSAARLEKLMLSLGYMLGEARGEVPTGDSWWAWASEDVGEVSAQEDHFLFNFVVLLECRDKARLAVFIRKYKALLERCHRTDPTFLSRIRTTFAAYSAAQDIRMLGMLVERQILTMAEKYRKRFYSKEGDMAYGLCYFIKGGVYGFLHLYDE